MNARTYFPIVAIVTTLVLSWASPSARALTFDLGRTLQIEDSTELWIDEGTLIPGVYYELLGARVVDGGRLVEITVDQFLTPLDRHALARLGPRPSRVVFLIENKYRALGDVKGLILSN